MIFIEEKKISSNSKSSEWIGIELPATYYLFSENSIFYKRIKDKNNKITWRLSATTGEWYCIEDTQSFEVDYFKYLCSQRERKLKRVLK